MIADSCARSPDERGDTSMILSDHRPLGCRRTISRKRQRGKFSCALHQRTSGCPCWRPWRRMISVTSIDDLVERNLRTLETVGRLERFEGHLFNWYDLSTLEPLR